MHWIQVLKHSKVPKDSKALDVSMFSLLGLSLATVAFLHVYWWWSLDCTAPGCVSEHWWIRESLAPCQLIRRCYFMKVCKHDFLFICVDGRRTEKVCACMWSAWRCGMRVFMKRSGGLRIWDDIASNIHVSSIISLCRSWVCEMSFHVYYNWCYMNAISINKQTTEVGLLCFMFVCLFVFPQLVGHCKQTM